MGQPVVFDPRLGLTGKSNWQSRMQLQKRRVPVTRRIVLLPLLAVALVGFVKGTTEKKVEIVKYPVPGSEDTVGEVETKEARNVLDDFYQSKVLEEQGQALERNDA